MLSKKSLSLLTLTVASAGLTTLSAGSIALTSATDIAAAGAATGVTEARVRNGRTGFEAALYSAGTKVVDRNFPGGSSSGGALITGDWRKFEVSYSVLTGELTLKVDANDDGSFGLVNTTSETLTYDFGTDGYSFQYIDLFYRGTAGKDAKIKDLVVDGTSQGPYDSNGANYTHAYFGRQGGGYFGDLLITGEFDFTGSQSDEVPSFGFVFRNKGVPTPTPDTGSTLVLLGSALATALLWRRQAR
ncbi:MAG: hypothetical protein J0M24_14050 [Verrucomicrobia bacterium]|nr:hypothetical protein [Verrucomicrobiota bacterium]